MTDATFADFDRPVLQPAGVNRVPEVTPGFWLIKLMAVTMGETAADYHPQVTVPAGGEARIHVDDGTVPGHLRANPNSLYVTSLAGKHVMVSVQADGSAAVQGTVEKDPGGAETAD